MKRIKWRKKLITINMGILLLASIITYPLFAKETMNEKGTTREETRIHDSNDKLRLGTRAGIGDKFTANIIHDGVKNLPCQFQVITPSSEGKAGEVEIIYKERGFPSGYTPAIDASTQGTIEIPNEVSDGSDIYKVTGIGEAAFYQCTNLKNTGIEKNSSITTISREAFWGCSSLLSTGLETNNSVTTIGKSAFHSCGGLKNTGLETNNSVTSVDRAVFQNCNGLMSTGLETNKTLTEVSPWMFYQCKGLMSTGLATNTTVKTVGESAFYQCEKLTSTGLETNATLTYIGHAVFSGCSSLKDVVFEIVTLPQMEASTFINTNVDIYYPPETTNSEILLNCGAQSANEMQISKVEIHTEPNKIMYVEEDVFDPDGLVLDVTYDNKKTVQRDYGDNTVASYFSFDKTELTTSDTKVAITYYGQSVNQSIDVYKKSITEIDIKTSPTKVNYLEGEEFDPSGLTIIVDYNNGKKDEITYDNTTKDDFSFLVSKKKIGNEKNLVLQLGDTHVLVTYQGKTTAVKISVMPKEIDTITVIQLPTKLTYDEGEVFDADGLVLEVLFIDGSKKEIVYTKDNKNDFIIDTRGLTKEDRNIKVSYKEKEVEIEIKVNARTEIIVSKPDEIVTPEKESLPKEKTVNTSDSTMVVGFIMLLGIAFTGIMKYKVK